MAVADLTLGQLYRISYGGRVWPNLYRYEGKSRPAYCQMHGEYMWHEHLFTKRRNSDVRPWSTGESWIRLEGHEFEPAVYPSAALTSETSR
jgi:hypothetical protein